MAKYTSLYCKIFVDAPDRNELADTVAEAFGIERHGWEVDTDWSEIDIVRNDDFDPEKSQAAHRSSFLYFPFYIELEPLEGTSEDSYIENAGHLLRTLWNRRWRAVAACDFEDVLPSKNGASGVQR